MQQESEADRATTEEYNISITDLKDINIISKIIKPKTPTHFALNYKQL